MIRIEAIPWVAARLAAAHFTRAGAVTRATGYQRKRRVEVLSAVAIQGLRLLVQGSI